VKKQIITVKTIPISTDIFDGKTIQDVKQAFDKISNDNIDMLYQGCTAKFTTGTGWFKNHLYLVFARLETDEEYQQRIKPE
jgi:hypothetical protein